jgi:superfamily II DNA or RNA helicase
MSKYPNISDKKFYEKINKIYADFKVKKDNRKPEDIFSDICYPKKYKLQLPQQFLSEFINPKTPYMGVLVYHRIGAGKTCAAIRTAEKWKQYKKIIVVVPASLKNNFRNELRSQCADNSYLKDNERQKLSKLHPLDKEYREIIKTSDKRIDTYYNIYSYNKFTTLLDEKKINFKNTLLIIDEIQNMVSEHGSFYSTLYNAIQNAPKDLRIMLLSATPMFDKPNEIGLTMNLLRLPKELPVGREFDKKFLKITKNSVTAKNMDLFKEYIKGYVSFFKGAPSVVFPDMKIKYVNCVMSDFQYASYKEVLKNENDGELLNNVDISDLPNNFYIGTRFVSNIVFPNKKIGDYGLKSFTKEHIKKNLQKYSCKFFEIMNKIKKTNGKVFIYSGFKEFGGIKSFIKVLEAFGYKNYAENGEGTKRFAVWSGDENITMKEEIKTVFNLKSNLKGQKIKIILGSPSIKEGVSLTSVRQVHVLEPYWNQSRLEQVIGRANRFCSHKDVEENKRNVKVYVYISVAPSFMKRQNNQKNQDKQTNVSNMTQTVDQYIYKLGIEKDKLIKVFEKAIKEVAVDCYLNKNANVSKGDTDIICSV